MSFMNLLAGGTIYPSRFVAILTTDSPAGSGGFKAVQADDSTYTIPAGISQVGTDFFPTSDTDHYAGNNYAAVSGENLQVFGQGEQDVLLELGATVTPGQLLKPDADGKGTPVVTNGGTTTPQYFGARAKQGGASGEKIRVEVVFGVYTYAA